MSSGPLRRSAREQSFFAAWMLCIAFVSKPLEGLQLYPI
jgi:hypothetical protein